MKSQIRGLRVAGSLFGLLGVVQLLRLVIRPEVLINGHLLPLWPSVLAVIILGSLSLWLLKLARMATG
jgi:hypothetical protein